MDLHVIIHCLAEVKFNNMTGHMLFYVRVIRRLVAHGDEMNGLGRLGLGWSAAMKR